MIQIDDLYDSMNNSAYAPHGGQYNLISPSAKSESSMAGLSMASISMDDDLSSDFNRSAKSEDSDTQVIKNVHPK